MAKRLNKKVALIGSIFMIVAMVAAIVSILILFPRNPHKLIEDAEYTLELARDAQDPDIRQRQYESAARSFLRARNYADTDELRVEVLFKLAQLYYEIDEWQNIHGIWTEITRLAPDKIEPRLGLLNFMHNVAQGSGRQWSQVSSQVDDFLEVAQSQGLLGQPLRDWQPYYMESDDYVARTLGGYLYLLKGRALYERARSGVVSDRIETLDQAVEILRLGLEHEPENVDMYLYIARSSLTRGDILASAGQFNQQQRARQEAERILLEGIEKADDKIQAQLNLLNARIEAAGQDISQLAEMESDFTEFAQQHPDNAIVQAALASYYLHRGHEYLSTAIETADKARELEPDNVNHALISAQLLHMKACIEQDMASMTKSIEIAERALKLPRAQQVQGPKRHRNQRNRMALYVSLLRSYSDSLLDFAPADQQQRQRWFENAEESIYQLSQLTGTGEHPEVVKWQGMLELAKGNRDQAIRQLYAVYNQLEAADTPDADVAYRLASEFMQTNEIGAVREFFATAFQAARPAHVYRPESLLKYAQLLMKVRHYESALNVVNAYEQRYFGNERSARLRIEALIHSGQYETASERLAQAGLTRGTELELEILLVANQVSQVQRTIASRALQQSLDELDAEQAAVADQTLPEPDSVADIPEQQFQQLRNKLAELAFELAATEPASLDEGALAHACEYFVISNDLAKASQIVENVLAHEPDNTAALLYKHLLTEPDPTLVEDQRRLQLQEKALNDIQDSIRRKVNLGVFYKTIEDFGRAREMFEQLIKSEPQTTVTADIDPDLQQRSEVEINSRLFAAEQLFEIALIEDDMELAEEMVALARRENLDRAQGNFFRARLLAVQQSYQQALSAINRSLELRPVFSRAYLLRSNIHVVNENYTGAVNAIQRASTLNPMDSEIARRMAVILYQHNEAAGAGVTSSQIEAADNAFRRAIALNTGQAQQELLSMYAEFIKDREPFNALAIRQNLLRSSPSIQNAVLLGELATELAGRQDSQQQQQSLYNIAEAAYQQALNLDPTDRVTLYNYAEYLRATGQEQMADQILSESEDPALLWRHYYNSGRYGLAHEVLESMHRHNPDDPEPLRGIILIAGQTRDAETALHYAQALDEIDQSVEAGLLIIKTYLDVGLIYEAQEALEQFNQQHEDPRASLLGAWLAQRQGRLEDALQLVNAHLQDQGDNAESWRLRGEINMLRSDYDQAIIDLNRSKSLDDRPQTRISLARAYQRAGRDQNAITELRGTIQRPDAPMEAGILLAEIYQRLGRTQALRDFYINMMESYPGNAHWFTQAGEFAFSSGDYQDAAKWFRQGWQTSKEQDNPNIDALDGYLKSLLELEQYQQLLTAAGAYLDEPFASVVYFRMAQARLATDDRGSAVDYFDRALTRVGTDEAVTVWILQKMHELLGSEEVERHARQMLEDNPDSFAANWTMFNLANLEGRYHRALEYLEKCQAGDTGYGLGQAQYVMQRTSVLQAAFDKTSDNTYLERAIEHYHRILEQYPDNATFLNNLAYLLALHDVDVQEALEYAQRAYRALPNAPHILDTYAYTLYKNDRLDEAENFVQAALQQYENNNFSVPADVWRNLGQIKAAQGQRQAAKDAFQQVLDSPDASEQIKEQVRREINELAL